VTVALSCLCTPSHRRYHCRQKQMISRPHRCRRPREALSRSLKPTVPCSAMRHMCLDISRFVGTASLSERLLGCHRWWWLCCRSTLLRPRTSERRGTRAGGATQGARLAGRQLHQQKPRVYALASGAYVSSQANTAIHIV
jgi:hypothetical protein